MSDEVKKLFPLPLTSMEQFHFWDSSAQFTNNIYARLRFDGLIDPAIADIAIQRVIDRHPLLRARLSKINNKLHWIWSGETIEPIDWQGANQQRPGPTTFDLTQQMPWRVVTKRTGNSTEMWFFTSHIVGDGLAGAQIASEWLRQYDSIERNVKPRAMGRLDPRQLKLRNRLGIGKRSYLKNIWKQPIGVFGAAKFIFRQPVSLNSEIIHSNWDTERQPHVIGTWLTAEQTKAIKAEAMNRRVNVNAILTGSLIRALSNHVTRSNTHSKWIRVLVPMSIRDFADRTMPASNRATIVQIDRSVEDIHREDFLAALYREIEIIRDWELGKLFLLAIKALSLIPGAVRRAATKETCRGTAVFANLGEPFRRSGLKSENGRLKVGNTLTLNEFDFVGPVRQQMPVSFTAQEYCEKIRLSMHVDPRQVSVLEAEELLQRFARYTLPTRRDG